MGTVTDLGMAKKDDPLFTGGYELFFVQGRGDHLRSIQHQRRRGLPRPASHDAPGDARRPPGGGRPICSQRRAWAPGLSS